MGEKASAQKIGEVMADALSVHHINYYVRSGFWLKKKPILSSVNLTIRKGECVGLVGQNGAGKTTLLKIFAGIIKPTGGHATILGKSSLSPYSKKHIAFLTENQYVSPHLTTREWLSVMGRCSGVTGRKLSFKVDSLLHEFGLCEYADKQMKDLSKGQKQRALISQLFVHDPKILILDEPMSGLDHVWREHMRVKLNSFRNMGGTIFFSSHIFFDIETTCDRVVYLKDGKVRWDGGIDDILIKSRMIQVVLKKNKNSQWLALGDVLWEKGDQVALLIGADVYKEIQHELMNQPSFSILRVNPYITSLEEMFEK